MSPDSRHFDPFASRDALLQQVRTLRETGRLAEALAHLSRFEAQAGSSGRLYQERAHCLIAAGQIAPALQALHEAVRRNPALPTSWDMLAQIHRMQGQPSAAAQAEQRLAILKALPVKVVAANCLHAEGDLVQAEAIIRDFLREDRENVGALHLLARLRCDQGAWQDAEHCLALVLQRAPDFHQARLDYVMALLQQEIYPQAHQDAQRLVRIDPDHREYQKALAAACIGLGDHEAVIDIYEGLLQTSGPQDTDVAEMRVFRGNALKIAGRGDEAIADYRAALAARPDYGLAWFSLANLKTFRFSHKDIAAMQSALKRPGLADLDKVYLNFALGLAFESQKDFESSWRHYNNGNLIRAQGSRYRPEAVETYAAKIKATFSKATFRAREDWGRDEAAPIFILGLPRSGSTLIEQILASHSEVEGTQELTEIGHIAGEVCGRDPDINLPLDPHAILRLSAEDAQNLAARYLRYAHGHRRLGRAFFIDKAPVNFWHIGLIQLILPQATLIDVRREPMSCGFSNFKQLFGGQNQAFSYRQDHIAHYYRTYLDVMRHWDEVLPGRVLRVHYEDVIADLSGSVKRLLAHCRLPYESACERFYETRRSIRTPSSEQVRQPIGRDGLEQWRSYEAWLEPLRTALGDALVHFRS